MFRHRRSQAPKSDEEFARVWTAPSGQVCDDKILIDRGRMSMQSECRNFFQARISDYVESAGGRGGEEGGEGGSVSSFCNASIRSSGTNRTFLASSKQPVRPA